MTKLRALTMALPQGREAAVQAVDRVWAVFTRPRELVSRGLPDGGPRIALSFDDGPSAANTSVVLDMLEAQDARGTFFVVGSRIEGHEDVIRRAAAAGHEVANHTYSHVHTVHLPRDELTREVTRANDVIADVLEGQSRMRLVRPPFGKDRRRHVAVARELGLLVVLWSIDSGDTLGYRTDEIVESVCTRAEPGSIVLMHDGGQRRDKTLTALEKLLPRLRADGFELVTISELLGLELRR
jgi:peptidoglycan/xylan/chitin deacetylase (PgdA/CDA1 family)